MLYIVPTPIGNLEDITLRAIRVLKEADLILAEDTRTTSKLLKHFGIETPLKAFHAHNEHRVLEEVLLDLESGKQLALVSDAGTPGISDPAFLLTRGCIERNIGVTCLPGATALVPALVLSGFGLDSFTFLGFLPHKKGRATRWKFIADCQETVVLYESPHRLERFLREAGQYLPADRRIAVVREISKLHEEVHRGTAEELGNFFAEHGGKMRGEIVVVIDRQG